MTLADDIATDMADLFDGTETVSLYDKSANTTDSSVTALPRQIRRTEIEAAVELGLQPIDCIWHVQTSTTDIVPEPGDEITDTSSNVWTILASSKDTLGTRYKCACRLQE